MPRTLPRGEAGAAAAQEGGCGASGRPRGQQQQQQHVPVCQFQVHQRELAEQLLREGEAALRAGGTLQDRNVKPSWGRKERCGKDMLSVVGRCLAEDMQAVHVANPMSPAGWQCSLSRRMPVRYAH